MESKIYSREEIDAMLAGDYERFPFEDAPAVIRQLEAKVDEAAKIEELLKGNFFINSRNYRICWDGTEWETETQYGPEDRNCYANLSDAIQSICEE